MSAKKPTSRAKRKPYGLRRSVQLPARLRVLFLIMLLVGGLYIVRLAYLQVARHGFYEALASGQRELYQDLFPERGSVFVQERDGEEVAIATNQYLNLIWADPRRIDDPVRTAQVLSEILRFDESDEDAERERDVDVESEVATDVSEQPEYDAVVAKLSKREDPYEPIQRRVSDEQAKEIERANLNGIYQLRERFRLYPEGSAAAHITGFVSPDENDILTGRYGLEGYFHELLRGVPGFLHSELDAKGRWISVGRRNQEPAADGADLLLTIDRTTQFKICSLLEEAVEKHEADRGSAIVLDPKTGAILAMCTAPSFDPNKYNEVESIGVYNNQGIFDAYEPGSVFKPLVMAGAIDLGAVSPTTAYEDTGEVKIDQFTIRNSDLKSHGRQTMTQVLEKSLNTGMIFVMRQMGQDQLARYVRLFGFGEPTGITLDTEVAGDVSSLDRKGEVYAATASYGQGLTATPLQLAAAYGALANGGTYMRPYIVQEVRHANGDVERTQPEALRQVIAPRSAQTTAAMLVSVVEHGHAGTAGVNGYYVAGKTGTAQVAKEAGAGYKEDETIATFIGFGPVSDPAFVALVRIDHPRTTPWAAGTAAPAFGEMAQFLLQYNNIPPDK